MKRSLLVVTVLLTAGLGSRADECPVDSKSYAAAPTQFDYLVLASMADAQAPLAMATYHPSEERLSEAREAPALLPKGSVPESGANSLSSD